MSKIQEGYPKLGIWKEKNIYSSWSVYGGKVGREIRIVKSRQSIWGTTRYRLTENEPIVIIANTNGYFYFLPMKLLLEGKITINAIHKWPKSYLKLPHAEPEVIQIEV